MTIVLNAFLTLTAMSLEEVARYIIAPTANAIAVINKPIGLALITAFTNLSAFAAAPATVASFPNKKTAGPIAATIPAITIIHSQVFVV